MAQYTTDDEKYRQACIAKTWIHIFLPIYLKFFCPVEHLQ